MSETQTEDSNFDVDGWKEVNVEDDPGTPGWVLEDTERHLPEYVEPYRKEDGDGYIVIAYPTGVDTGPEKKLGEADTLDEARQLAADYADRDDEIQEALDTLAEKVVREASKEVTDQAHDPKFKEPDQMSLNGALDRSLEDIERSLLYRASNHPDLIDV